MAGDRMPSLETYRRISELYGWPRHSSRLRWATPTRHTSSGRGWSTCSSGRGASDESGTHRSSRLSLGLRTRTDAHTVGSMSSVCDCAHEWRTARDDPSIADSAYTCRLCGRRLERFEELPWRLRKTPHLNCDRNGPLLPCNWPRCVGARRSLRKRLRDALRSFGWWIDATMSGG